MKQQANVPGGRSGIRRHREKVLQNTRGKEAYDSRGQGYSWVEIAHRFGSKSDAVRRLAWRYAGDNGQVWPIDPDQVESARTKREGRKYYRFMEDHSCGPTHAAKYFDISTAVSSRLAKGYAKLNGLSWPVAQTSPSKQRAEKAYRMRGEGKIWREIAVALHYPYRQSAVNCAAKWAQQNGFVWPPIRGARRKEQ